MNEIEIIQETCETLPALVPIRQTITPENEEHWKAMRLEVLTSTDIAALFDLSPYLTKFELWYRKRDKVLVDFEMNERMKWGKRLESSIAEGVAEEQGWVVKPMKDFWILPEHRAGSSFDFAILDTDSGFVSPETPVRGILEIKNVDYLQFKQGWLVGDDGEIEAPTHIELQVQHQMWITGLPVAYIAALVGGNDVKLIRRERDEEVISRIQAEVQSFWESIDNDQPPPPDFAKDADFIAKLYGYAEVNSVLDATGNAQLERLADNYKEASGMIKQYEAMKDAAKAEILTLIGTYEKVRHDRFSISAGLIGPSQVNYERSGYRNFKINWRK